MMLSITVALAVGANLIAAQSVPSPPTPEAFEFIELPLPPVSSSTDEGACTSTINPHGTGCIGQAAGEFQAGDFTPNGNNVIVNVEFVGAPAAPDPASVYSGEQVILIKADGTNFSTGDPWKCLSCGVPAANAVSLDPERDYPHVLRSGTKALWGHNILDCDGELLESDACTPNKTHIYPIYWPTAADGSGKGGSPRELRMHPDDTHMGWSSFTADGGQFAYCKHYTSPVMVPRLSCFGMAQNKKLQAPQQVTNTYQTDVSSSMRNPPQGSLPPPAST